MTKRKPGKSAGRAKPSKKATPRKPAATRESVQQAAPRPAQVSITAAKGRPMLTWVGKRPLSQVTAFPPQRVEQHSALRILGIDPTSNDALNDRMEVFRQLRSQCNEKCWENAPFIGTRAPEVGGLLFHGHNKDVLATLLANGYRGKVDLAYIDPPFDSGADYVRQINLRGIKNGAKLAAQQASVGEQIQYTDIWANDNYLQFMYEKLLLIKELLSARGSIYVHCDQRKQHHLRFLLDEVFGLEAFRNQIIRVKCNPKNFEREAYGNVHDVILFYSKGDEPTWNDQVEELQSEDIQRLFPEITADGRRYTTVALHAPGTRKGPTGKPWREVSPPSGRHWAYVPETLDRFDAEGKVVWSSTGNPRLILFADEQGSRRVQDIWTMKDPTYPTYPTEKNADVLNRIISASTLPGDLVLDCFVGSGTTLAEAQALGRRWIGCDINKGAIQTTLKRLRGIIAEQIAEARKRAAQAKQGTLLDTAVAGEEVPPKPCQFGFTVWRVNDYDLQIQHNEAVNLACEHIGVERNRSDSFFDGTLGKKLAKIVPFGHPLSPIDLEEVQRELEARPDEDRSIVLVCLGLELVAKAWVEEWNRLRKGDNAVNRIEVIELRTDPKYGRFIRHEPATARIKVTRVKRNGESRVVVEIQDFISPTIIERLREQAGVLSPKIDDWRSMVDCIYIDPAYDGSVLNVALADVPERKADLVGGKYELSAPPEETTVAVKLVDMLGEEVLMVSRV